MKDRAARVVGRCVQASTVGFDDRPTNGKSYSRALGFCREERLEDTVFVLTVYSRPGVFNGDQNSRRPIGRKNSIRESALVGWPEAFR